MSPFRRRTGLGAIAPAGRSLDPPLHRVPCRARAGLWSADFDICYSLSMALIARAPWLPAGAVALSAGLWGLWWLPLRALADAGLSGPALNAAFYGIASIALLPLCWQRRARIAAGGPLLLGAGGLFGAALVSWNLALIQGEVVRVTLLFYLAPVWATLLAAGLLREPVGGRRVASVALGLAGAAVLLGFAHGLPLPQSVGDWLGLGAGMLFALSVTLVRKGEAISGLEQTLASFAAATLLSLLLLPLAPHPGGPIALSVLAWTALAALAWLLPCTWLLLWGACHLEPGRVSLLLLLEVAVAALSAALLAGEPFGMREAAGCILILAAGALEGGAELRPALRRRSALPLAVPRSARARRPPAAEEQAVRADDAAESREPMCGGRSGDGA